RQSEKIGCNYKTATRRWSRMRRWLIGKTAYATIKGIEVMRALRKGQASSFYYGQPQGEVCLINRVFGL
ncbi:hypothetical protein ACI2IV_12965, partial [Psychrobacter faecalis]